MLFEINFWNKRSASDIAQYYSRRNKWLFLYTHFIGRQIIALASEIFLHSFSKREYCARTGVQYFMKDSYVPLSPSKRCPFTFKTAVVNKEEEKHLTLQQFHFSHNKKLSNGCLITLLNILLWEYVKYWKSLFRKIFIFILSYFPYCFILTWIVKVQDLFNEN